MMLLWPIEFENSPTCGKCITSTESTSEAGQQEGLLLMWRYDIPHPSKKNNKPQNTKTFNLWTYYPIKHLEESPGTEVLSSDI